MPADELALVIKALAYGSRRQAWDLYRLLEIADSYFVDEIGGWRPHETPSRGLRRDAAVHLHELGRRSLDLEAPAGLLATLIAALVTRPNWRLTHSVASLVDVRRPWGVDDRCHGTSPVRALPTGGGAWSPFNWMWLTGTCPVRGRTTTLRHEALGASAEHLPDHVVANTEALAVNGTPVHRRRPRRQWDRELAIQCLRNGAEDVVAHATRREQRVVAGAASELIVSVE